MRSHLRRKLWVSLQYSNMLTRKNEELPRTHKFMSVPNLHLFLDDDS
ncbi:hypothetical protein SLEP1_g39610 [Rubroshorea leprosula]|uniref:Uncharacterized protein n=1 Tax=Rubroshorea leprosula TaxID=152421 RepID=A0AAV5L0R6_9ROSI|nr:hypothetical protein SLEP1_g39610 [Rubroshorea leprosula]